MVQKNSVKSHKITLNTVWKFQDFHITQILREIHFGESRSSKTAQVANSETLDSSTLISRKIWVTGNSCNLHTVQIPSFLGISIV